MKTLLRFAIFFVVIFSQLSVNGQGLHTRQAQLPCVDKVFTVVAHIVRDSFGNANITEAEILDAIANTNPAFEPICVSFEICEFRYIDNFQYDQLSQDDNEWDELQVQYHVARRINMFFVSDIGDANSYVCGFAGLSQITNLESSGIVIQKGDCATPGTIIHEFGHYFGLLHTFEGEGLENVDGSNCETEGDLICDTPADPFRVGDAVEDYVSVEDGCRFINQRVDANGQFYAPDVGNYMSYYPGACSCGFTYGQYVKMANTFLNSPDKMW